MAEDVRRATAAFGRADPRVALPARGDRAAAAPRVALDLDDRVDERGRFEHWRAGRLMRAP